MHISKFDFPIILVRYAFQKTQWPNKIEFESSQ